MKKYIIALDQGTTSSRCLIFGKDGSIVSSAQKEFKQYFPNPGWVEHDPVEIWTSQLSVTVEAMAKIGAVSSDVAGIGITNQRETTMVWNKKTGKCIYPAIVWQCRRTAEMLDKIKKDEKFCSYVHETTGLIPDAYFSASKIAWILENVKGAREMAKKGELLFGTVDTWLIYNLTDGNVHVTDYTNASRTMLFDIHNCKWDEKICDYFKIPMSMLPNVKPSSYVYGHTLTQHFGGEIPISGAAGDQQCALFGQCCFDKGEAKNTYGTGGFILMNTGDKAVKSKNGLLTTMAAAPDRSIKYALEGSIFISGAGIQWLRDELKILESADKSEKMASSVKDNDGVYLVPAFTGLGAPYWNPYARGMIVGLTRGTKREHVVRAMVEAMAYQINDLISIMEDESGTKLKALKIDGGASKNNFLAQFQSDISNIEVERPACVETTGMGAAFLAGLAVGFWKDTDELKECIKDGKRFAPVMDKEKRDKLLNGWKRAVKAAVVWASAEE